ncbi:MAG: hypothetical protein LQ344_001448 [Seirophora lacunosa]|nr:MAG: hypothetical protein LQ344_001448 [Seirophora lacunosa]
MIIANPVLSKPSSWLNRFVEITRPDIQERVGYFPPGPPEPHYLHPIIDSDLAIEFYPLGFIPNRNETLVKDVLRQALYDSLNYRTTAKMPGRGYKMQEREFLLSVSHSAGVGDLTWGMWTVVLGEMQGYVDAYPGYDYQFEIRKYRDWEIAGYVIGAGFVETRA